MVITVDYLATWWKQKSLQNCENVRSGWGHFATKSWPNLKSGGHEHDPKPLPVFVFFSTCYAFERMNTSKMIQIERFGKNLIVLNNYNLCKCEDSNDGSFVVWFVFLF